MDRNDIERLKSYSLEDTTLRDYQQENKQKVYDAWERVDSVMLQMPTGTGKTRLFVSIIKDLFNYSRDNKSAIKVLILVHRTELIDQIDEVLGLRYNLAHGIIQSGERERKIYPVQLASVQTLSRRLNNWTEKEFDFIIVDEAHHVKAESYQRIIKAFPSAKLLGVTATPVRLNGAGFTDTFDELIISPSVKDFIEKGYLSQYEYYSVARSSFIQREIDSIKKFSQGDYAESELERVCDNDRIRAQVVQTYLDFANDKKGIVYTINKEHNKKLCEQFNGKGVQAVAIDSDTPQEVREQCIRQFRRGDYKIICNVNLFTEGFDCPDIEFIQLARPTKSLALYLQQVGRGLRISESKAKTLILDNVGLYNRFGFPSSRRRWKQHFEGRYLDNIQEEQEEPKSERATSEPKHRRQNLEEGEEQVHLIQTTDEKEYFDYRKQQFLDWIQEYIEEDVEIINSVYENLYVNGLEMEFVDVYGLLGDYTLRIKEQTPELDEILNNREFKFFEEKDEKDPKCLHAILRKCKDYDELGKKLGEIFQERRSELLKFTLSQLAHKYKELQYSKDEIDEIINDLILENKQTSIVPNALKGENVGIIPYVFFFYNYSLEHRKNKSVEWLGDPLLTELVRRIKNKEIKN